MRVALPFYFGACMGAGMATRRACGQPSDGFFQEADDEAQEAEQSPRSGAGGQTDKELIQSARRSLMQAIPETACALATGASGGSVPHIKLLLQLVGLDEGSMGPETAKRREKTLEEIVMEQWRKEP